MRKYESYSIYQAPNVNPEQWNVEALNTDEDGGIDLTMFSGPFSEKRAREYAKLVYQD